MDNNAKLRPLYLAKILYERTDEGHYLTTMQLAQILEEEYGIPAHRQTIKTDIELLQQFGMDIQEVKSTQNRYNLISRQFEIAELKLLIDAVQSSKFISKERSEQMVSKIVTLAGQHKAEELKRNASVEGRVKSENRQDLEFANITEYAHFVSNHFDAAIQRYSESRSVMERGNDVWSNAAVLRHLDEQVYTANRDVHTLLKIYYPEYAKDRHFLSYPIGQFFSAIYRLWDYENGKIKYKIARG